MKRVQEIDEARKKRTREEERRRGAEKRSGEVKRSGCVRLSRRTDRGGTETKRKKRETGRMDNIQVTGETLWEEASVEKRDWNFRKSFDKGSVTPSGIIGTHVALARWWLVTKPNFSSITDRYYYLWMVLSPRHDSTDASSPFLYAHLCTDRTYVPVTSTTRVKRILPRDLSTYDIDNVDRGSCVFEKLIFCFVKTISLANGNVLLNYDPWSITDPNRHPS